MIRWLIKQWAAFCLGRAQDAQNACWGIQDGKTWYDEMGRRCVNTPGVDRREERDRWYARYDAAQKSVEDAEGK